MKKTKTVLTQQEEILWAMILEQAGLKKAPLPVQTTTPLSPFPEMDNSIKNHLICQFLNPQP